MSRSAVTGPQGPGVGTRTEDDSLGELQHHQSLDCSASCPLSWGPGHVQWTWQYQVQDPFRTSLFSSLGGPGSLLD